MSVSLISFHTSSPISINLLHKRLGHPSKHAMQTILKTKCLPYVNINKHSFAFCDACQFGKMHQLHFSPTKIISTTPLELVHIGLWGLAFDFSLNGYGTTSPFLMITLCTAGFFLYF